MKPFEDLDESVACAKMRDNISVHCILCGTGYATRSTCEVLNFKHTRFFVISEDKYVCAKCVARFPKEDKPGSKEKQDV